MRRVAAPQSGRSTLSPLRRTLVTGLHRRMLLVTLLLLGAASPCSATEPTTLRVLLLSQGPDGHPPETHEYDAGVRLLERCLANVPNLEVVTARADGAWPEGPELISRADCVVLFLSQGAKWMHEEPRRLEAFGRLAGRGGGLVALHWAMGTKEAPPIRGFLELFGGCHGGPERKYEVLETDVSVANPDHAILRGISNFRVYDEFYYELKFVDSSHPVQQLLKAEIGGKQETVAWAWERGDGGRSFGFSGIHFHRNWRLEQYRRLVVQGILWTLDLPIPENGLPVEVSARDLKLAQ